MPRRPAWSLWALGPRAPTVGTSEAPYRDPLTSGNRPDVHSVIKPSQRFGVVLIVGQRGGADHRIGQHADALDADRHVLTGPNGADAGRGASQDDVAGKQGERRADVFDELGHPVNDRQLSPLLPPSP